MNNIKETNDSNQTTFILTDLQSYGITCFLDFTVNKLILDKKQWLLENLKSLKEIQDLL